MIGFTRAGRRHLVSRLIGIGLVVTSWGVWDSRPASASPIKGAHHDEEAVLAERAAGGSWSAYLLAGPKLWSTMVHPSVTPEVRASIWRALGSDRAESNPWVEFLLWKQSLDPTRFAHYHPHVVPVLDRISRENLITPVTQTSTPPSTVTPITEPQSLTPAVPEPGAWLLAFGMTGWGLWWRRRQR
jgi:hypothetical protein